MDQNTRKALSLIGFGALTAGAAVLGARSTRRGMQPWYFFQRKPRFNPPNWVFAPVWTALYTLIAASGYRVFNSPRSPERARALALWGVQMAANSAWSWLFFGRHRKRAALADLGVMLAATGGYAAVARRVDRPAAWMMAPYLAWTSFAGVLNEELIRLNP